MATNSISSLYLPPVKNTVNVIQRENDIIYSEQSEVNGRRKQVDSLLTDSLQPGSDFDNISLNSTTPSTPSTVYRVCTPLITQESKSDKKSDTEIIYKQCKISELKQ